MHTTTEPLLVPLSKTKITLIFFGSAVFVAAGFWLPSIADQTPFRDIGRSMMEHLQSRMKGFLVVTLTAAPEVQPFYRRFGWRNQTTAMILPRSQEQARLNCEDV